VRLSYSFTAFRCTALCQFFVNIYLRNFSSRYFTTSTFFYIEHEHSVTCMCVEVTGLEVTRVICNLLSPMNLSLSLRCTSDSADWQFGSLTCLVRVSLNARAHVPDSVFGKVRFRKITSGRVLTVFCNRLYANQRANFHCLHYLLLFRCRCFCITTSPEMGLSMGGSLQGGP